jgi:3-oxoacyl-[acyl-carrier protein] reductase
LKLGGKLEGKVALVAGASRNIGKAVAIGFARQGCDLIVNARASGDELEAVADTCREIGASVVTAVADVSDGPQVHDMVRQGLDHFGHIDVLVNLVKIRPQKPFVELTYEDWRSVMAVNLDGMFHLCRAVVPSMIERRSGSIIAFSQPFQPRHLGGRTSHVLAAKFGTLGLVDALSVELGPFGIRVNAVGPGRIESERRHPEWYGASSADTAAAVLSHVPLGRPGRVDEVAAATVFLASDDSSYITGALIPCNGGQYSLLE